VLGAFPRSRAFNSLLLGTGTGKVESNQVVPNRIQTIFPLAGRVEITCTFRVDERLLRPFREGEARLLKVLKQVFFFDIIPPLRYGGKFRKIVRDQDCSFYCRCGGLLLCE
jgi:hypothetical protein